MCGIVGYVGRKEVLPILIEGLRNLEYRGYDSAGLAIQNAEKLVVVKEKGKVSELAHLTLRVKPVGSCGIAHTRWATHGEPSRINAHPHLDGSGEIAIVHNGIIENYQLLKKKLQTKGCEFRSATDSEVVAHLIDSYYEGDLAEAVRRSLLELEGTYGLAVISSRNPGLIVGARKGSPLVLGVGEDEFFLASDVSALVRHTKNVVYLGEGNLVALTAEGYQTSTLDAKKITPSVHRVDFDIAKMAKGGYPHFMLKEIHEQPETITNAMRGHLIPEEGSVRLDGLNQNIQELREIRRIIIAACGTSWHAALAGEYMIEELAGIPVEVEYASEFRYRNPIIDSKSLLFVISQSGETADTLAALREAKHKGATVLGICNVVGSTIARETNGGLYLHAGPEVGVASTKAFTSQLTVLAMVGLLLGRMRRISPTHGQEIVAALQKLPRQVAETLKLDKYIQQIARKYYKKRNFLYLGRSYNFPVALEGALKLKEISYIHAEGYPAAEMKHGPIALIDKDMPTVVIAPRDGVYDKVISNIEEVRARGGQIIAIGTERDKILPKLAHHVIYVPKTLSMLSPFLTVIPLQLLAYHIAVLRGCSVDQPRNLAKSVTVE